MVETRKRLILIGLIIASMIPIALLIPSPATDSSLKVWALYGSVLTGYIGIAMLLWMFVLGTRATMALVFHDLAPVLRIHKLLGKYGSIAILLHPLLVIYSYGESLLYSIVPQLGTEFERHVTLGRIAFMLVVGIWLTSVLLRSRMSFRPWKYIHYLAYISLPFALLHVPDVGTQYMSHVAVKAYFFALVLAFVTFCVIRLRSLLNLDRVRYRVVSQSKLDDISYAITLAPDDDWIVPARGQYVYLKLGFVSEDHPFSVMQYDEDSHELTVAYRVFGAYSNALSQVQPGESVYVGGPFGSFTQEIESSDQPVVFIAGGIGITPFVDHILRGDEGRETWLFFASPTPERAVCLPMLREELGPRCVPVYNDSTDSTDAEAGYIDADLIKKYLTSPADYHYFICGPAPMMKAVSSSLTALGVSRDSIHTEEFAF